MYMLPTIQDRGADREPRFYVVLPAGTVALGTPIATAQGTYPLRSIGTTYSEGLAYHYLAVDAATLGAPTHVTPELLALRAEQQARRTAQGKARWARMSPEEHKAAVRKWHGKR